MLGFSRSGLRKGYAVVNHTVTRERIEQAAEYVRARATRMPLVAVILGSGLGMLAERVKDPVVIPYGDIPGFPLSTVPGHSGRLVIGSLGMADALLMQGRVHYYEGYSAAEVAFPVRVLYALGVRGLCITNAAGGLHPEWRPGDLMLISDHINLIGLAGHNPLRGPNDDSLGPRFPSMLRAYDPEFISIAQSVARSRSIQSRVGVYAMVAGPSFETPAESRMLRALGADAVGMSTAPEVVAARHAGMRVLGISVISNIVADTQQSLVSPSHAEVLQTGERSAPELASLIEGVLPQLVEICEQG